MERQDKSGRKRKKNCSAKTNVRKRSISASKGMRWSKEKFLQKEFTKAERMRLKEEMHRDEMVARFEADNVMDCPKNISERINRGKLSRGYFKNNLYLPPRGRGCRNMKMDWENNLATGTCCHRFDDRVPLYRMLEHENGSGKQLGTTIDMKSLAESLRYHLKTDVEILTVNGRGVVYY
ncbi:hypothetical protein P3S67_000506 [Capsicum chacoense]